MAAQRGLQYIRNVLTVPKNKELIYSQYLQLPRAGENNKKPPEHKIPKKKAYLSKCTLCISAVVILLGYIDVSLLFALQEHYVLLFSPL